MYSRVSVDMASHQMAACEEIALRSGSTMVLPEPRRRLFSSTFSLRRERLGAKKEVEEKKRRADADRNTRRRKVGRRVANYRQVRRAFLRVSSEEKKAIRKTCRRRRRKDARQEKTRKNMRPTLLTRLFTRVHNAHHRNTEREACGWGVCTPP